jgi:magnesium-transporting ATPase (P-type)
MNLMTDIPEMTISTDRVDDDLIDRPRRLDTKFIRKFMVVFGLLSTIFDYITFGALVSLFHLTSIDQFRTAWFIESVISASIVVLVIRTRQPLFKSMPRKYLLLSTLSVVGITLILPFNPHSRGIWIHRITLLLFVFGGNDSIIVYCHSGISKENILQDNKILDKRKNGYHPDFQLFIISLGLYSIKMPITTSFSHNGCNLTTQRNYLW